MKPGPEMDAAVARALGWEYHDGAFDYGWGPKGTLEKRLPSEFDADAIAALEATGCDFVIEREGDNWDVTLWGRGRIRDYVAKLASKWGGTLREAACRAILARSEEKEKQG